MIIILCLKSLLVENRYILKRIINSFELKDDENYYSVAKCDISCKTCDKVSTNCYNNKYYLIISFIKLFNLLY